LAVVAQRRGGVEEVRAVARRAAAMTEEVAAVVEVEVEVEEEVVDMPSSTAPASDPATATARRCGVDAASATLASAMCQPRRLVGSSRRVDVDLLLAWKFVGWLTLPPILEAPIPASDCAKTGHSRSVTCLGGQRVQRRGRRCVEPGWFL
jgi:hypothetical protein